VVGSTVLDGRIHPFSLCLGHKPWRCPRPV
jgi:hypothetical protein